MLLRKIITFLWDLIKTPFKYYSYERPWFTDRGSFRKGMIFPVYICSLTPQQNGRESTCVSEEKKNYYSAIFSFKTSLCKN